jgi:RimJ/RimL family protein N-acetyltransferase
MPERDGIKLIPADENGLTLKKIRQDFDVLKNLSEVYSYSAPMPSSITFAIDMEENIVGAIVLKNIRWINRKTEITIYLDKSFQNKGIGRQVLEMAKDYIFNILNFHRIEVEVFSYNTNAIRLFERSGFKREGILREARFFDGKYHDIIRFGLLKSEYSSDK